MANLGKQRKQSYFDLYKLQVSFVSYMVIGKENEALADAAKLKRQEKLKKVCVELGCYRSRSERKRLANYLLGRF